MTAEKWASSLLFLGVFLSLVLLGCQGCPQSAEDLPPWRFVSDAAEYEVTFPGDWRREPAGSINPFAELAASRESTLFFMVIPQEMPQFPRAQMSEMRDLAIARLEETVEDFTIDRQGHVEVDGVTGTTIFASGRLNDRSIAYINTYLIHGDFGYQLIAFTEREHKEKLFQEMDFILSTWRFQTSEQEAVLQE